MPPWCPETPRRVQEIRADMRKTPSRESRYRGQPMTADYPTDEVAATPEYVLEVLRDWHRIAVAANEALFLKLTFETPLLEWEESYCIEDWGRFGVAMSEVWDIDLPVEKWREFARIGKTVSDLCRVIAALATRPVIRPWRHAAGDCLPAGAFLTVRSM